MSTSIQEQDLIQTIKQLEQRISDLERQQRTIAGTSEFSGGQVVRVVNNAAIVEFVGLGYNSITYGRQGGPVQYVDINFNANGFLLDYSNDSSSNLGWLRLSDQLDLRLDAHDVNIPATPTSTGTKGVIKWDGSHLYLCTATNTWRRVAIGTW